VSLVSLFIITRFNVRLKFKNSEKFDPLDTIWIQERVKLFKSFCLPSLLCQEDQNYEWFIMFDHETPSNIIDEVVTVPQIIPIFSKGFSEGLNHIRERLKNRQNCDYICSVRLDSDDMLAPFFVKKLRHIAEASSQLVDATHDTLGISFVLGCEYDKILGQFFSRQYPGNQFIALLEKDIDSSSKLLPKTCFLCEHYSVSYKVNTLLINEQCFSWCINVHGGNVANQIKGDMLNEAPNEFSILADESYL
jgi:hypothetical protein